MENASKALIIAGAILIAILLIGVGMYVYNSSMKPIDQSGQQMDAQAIQMFNARIEQYVGTGLRAAQVRTCLSEVNSLSKSEASNKVIDVVGEIKNGKTVLEVKDVENVMKSLKTNSKYDIKVTYNDKNVGGSISKVIVTEQ